MKTVAQDVRYGVRLLARQRGFAIVAVLTIALGVGISVALFSVIDAALLHPLPYSHPEQLVTIDVAEQDQEGRPIQYGPSLDDLRTWRSRSSVLTHVGMGRVHGDFVAQPRHRMVLLTLLGIFAACLTLVGIASTTAYTVARRTHELGVRLALGATHARVVMNVLADVTWAIAMGVAWGLLGAFYSTRIVSRFLFRTTPHDLFTFVTAAAVLVACAVLAAWLPARRAARLNPVVALRAD
jgi:ABC-type antimicrobial peptide transport system permease subunit